MSTQVRTDFHSYNHIDYSRDRFRLDEMKADQQIDRFSTE